MLVGCFDIIIIMQLFVECVEELHTDDPLRVNTSLLLGTAAFERALGDVSVFIMLC